MDAAGMRRSAPAPGSATAPSLPGGLLNLLGVAAVVLDSDGRIRLWSPQARDLFGWSAEEALGRYAARLLIAEEHFELALELFTEVMDSGKSWAGVFPARHKDGSTRLVEFRNMRLRGRDGAWYALGIAADEVVVREVERDLALSSRLVAQSPIGLAVFGTDLRYVLVNPALERINGVPARRHLGHTVTEVLPHVDTDLVQTAMRSVLATGTPLLDQFGTGRTPADPDRDHAWLASFYRLEDPGGRVIGVAVSVVDVTEQHHADQEVARARRRLAVVAHATARIGTTLDLEQTARELADTVVPDLADLAAVDLLDSVLPTRTHAPTENGPARFRALAVKAAYPTDALEAADPIGEVSRYEADRLVTRCVTSGQPVHIPHLRADHLHRIARDDAAAAVLARSGAHSYLALPLTARGEVLGALDLIRARNPRPFDADDLLLAEELASRAAVCIDNARWYQAQLHAATALQRHLLPQPPPNPPGIKIACRYQPAAVTGHVGGDWYDVIPLRDQATTVLVVGDVMGHGINAAATMGQLRTTARALVRLGLDPADILRQLDELIGELDDTIATCAIAICRTGAPCRIALAGHLPPVLHPESGPPTLLDLPPGAPLGAAATVPFTTTQVPLAAAARLILYTDGLIEGRDHGLGTGLEAILDELTGPRLPIETTCDHLLVTLTPRDGHDDITLLIAESQNDPCREEGLPEVTTS
ncbi:SpoIIE family protein phosphatase [Streptomyces sp. NPDC046805]|uniref:SpoIIE family protein phosphatase n=1 Tax=Streptomyces sp. NPDC046805 TaxID=3155134 RepID=UPI0033E36F71